MDSPTLVTIAVLTFHRPEQIRQTVALLCRQAREQDAAWQVEVLVVDNDPAGSGRAAVEALDLPGVRVVVESTPGIAAARNRALDEARGRDVLLFLDDDGRPAPGWLSLMLETWRQSHPAAVAGWVDTRYLGRVDPWIHAGGFFTRRRWRDGQPLQAAACGNLLLDLHQLGDLRFARSLGLSGGEDTLLTRQLVARGGRIVFCHDAVVEDQVAVERMTRGWVLQRALSHGNTGGLLDIHLSSSALARPRLLAQGLVRLAGGGLRSGLGTVTGDRTHSARGARAAMRGLGMVLAATGLAYQEYQRHGSWRQRFSRVPEDLAPGQPRGVRIKPS
ncbi:glycosyltransferase family 2 protein [Luteococcus sp. Sow4_B9]|uniref:glycosyltransferase family 2 protein n=1 Tax=Luteococcus sp. Sow4_B9 TaxID=3438792 RepID=UPI003F95EFB7